MSDPTGASSDPGPLLEGLSALVLAVTGGIATVVGLIRAGSKKNTTTVPPTPTPADTDKRLADVLLDMHERDLQARDRDYRRVVKHNHRLEDLLNAHHIPLPSWEDDDDDD